jgi:hypothetical protein
MKQNYQNIFISLPEELGEEIEAKVEFSIQNDGIGPYEYWGQKCYDAGQDYIEVENIIPIFTDQTEERKIVINKYIADNFKSLSNDAAMDMVFEHRE